MSNLSNGNQFSQTPPPVPPQPPMAPPPTPPTYPPAYASVNPPQKKSKAGLIIGLCAGGAALVIAIVLFLVIDPLGLLGGSKTVAQAVPQGAEAYASIDLLKMMDANVEDTVTAFTKNTDADITTQQELIDRMDQDLEDSYGVTFSDDVKSWLGTSAAFFVNDLEENSGDPTVTLVVLVRNTGSADRFIKKLKAGIEEKQSATIDDTRYHNVTIYSFQSDYDYSTLAFARSGKVFLVSNSTEGIESAIDAQKGSSLAQDATFKQLSKVLPSNGAIFFYIPSQTVSTLLSEEETGLSSLGYGSFTSLDFYQATAMSVSFLDSGVSIESAVAYDLDQMSDTQKTFLQQAQGASRLISDFPEDTFFFMGGNRLDLAWSTYREMVTDALGSDFDESMNMAEESIGFNPDQDLLPILNGQYALGIFDDPNGLLSEMANVNMGMQMIFESTESDRLRQYSADIADLLTADEIGVDHDSSGSMETWTVSEPYLDSDLFAYGVNDSALIFSTNAADLRDAFGRSSSLADSQNFKKAWSSLDNGMTPVFYLDFPALLDELTNTSDIDLSSEDVAVLAPIQTIVMGTSKLQGSIQHSQMIITLDKSK